MKLLCLAMMVTCAQSAFAEIAGGPKAITYADADGVQQIRVFAVASSGHLGADAWDGTEWSWFDLGLPPGARTLMPTLSAVTYLDGAGTQQIRVFAIGYPSFSLIVAAWDGTSWSWFDLGKPSGSYPFNVNAVTYTDASGNQFIAVFASTSHLVVDVWDGGAWTWYDLGRPAGTTLVDYPSAIVYNDSAGNAQIRVFVAGYDGRLYVDAGDGVSWRWFDLGLSATGAKIYVPDAITYPASDGTQQIRVFTYTEDLRLSVAAWDGVRWEWFDVGQPARLLDSSAITYLDSDGTPHIRVFTPSIDSDMWAAAWDNSGADWSWFDLGNPALEPIFSPNAVTYVDPNGVQQIRVFAVAGPPSSQQLVAASWDGSAWSWSLLGSPQ